MSRAVYISPISSKCLFYRSKRIVCLQDSRPYASQSHLVGNFWVLSVKMPFFGINLESLGQLLLLQQKQRPKRMLRRRLSIALFVHR